MLKVELISYGRGFASTPIFVVWRANETRRSTWQLLVIVLPPDVSSTSPRFRQGGLLEGGNGGLPFRQRSHARVIKVSTRFALSRADPGSVMAVSPMQSAMTTGVVIIATCRPASDRRQGGVRCHHMTTM